MQINCGGDQSLLPRPLQPEAGPPLEDAGEGRSEGPLLASMRWREDSLVVYMLGATVPATR